MTDQRRTRPGRRLMWGGAAVLVAIVALLLATRWAGGSRLERYRAQLRAQGEVLEWAGVMTNRAVSDGGQLDQLVKAVGDLQGRAPVSDKVYPDVQYHAPGRVLVPWRQEMDWQAFQEEIGMLRERLGGLRRALADPDRRTNRNPSGPIQHLTTRPGFTERREAAFWLWRSHVGHLHAGDLDRALEDLHALLDLARLHEQDGFLVDQMSRVAITGIGAKASWNVLQMEGWDDARLAALSERWAGVRMLEPLVSSVTMERAMGVWFFQLARTNAGAANQLVGAAGTGSGMPLDALVVEPLWRMTFVDDDELRYLRNMQRNIECMRHAVRHHSWRDAQAVYDAIDAPAPPPPLTRLFRDRYSSALVPHWMKALAQVMKTETERQMILAAIAIRRHELKNGGPPASIGALVPGLLGEVPVDGMDGRPLRYALLPDGTWRLYSVGIDFKDDGGDPSWSSGNANDSLWNGIDAVWPEAVFE